MVERVVIEDDYSPINETIVLTPSMIQQNHNKLMASNVYEKMALYIFNEMDNKLNNLDDEVYDLLSPAEYKKIDSATVEISDYSFSLDDYVKYLNHFLEVIDKQQLKLLYDDLVQRELISDNNIFSSELSKNLKGFKVKDLLNRGKYNKALKYDLESVKGTESSFINNWLDSKPIYYPNIIKKHIELKKNALIFDSESYIKEVLTLQKLIPRGKDLTDLKVGKIKTAKKKDSKDIKDAIAQRFLASSGDDSSRVGSIQNMRVTDTENIEFEGMYVNKTVSEYDEVINILNNLLNQTPDLDLSGNSMNPIKASLMSAVTPNRGKLGVGRYEIVYSYRKKFKGMDLFSKDGIKTQSIFNILRSMGYKKISPQETEDSISFEYESASQGKKRRKEIEEAQEEGEELVSEEVKETIEPFIPLITIDKIEELTNSTIDFNITNPTFLGSKFSNLAGKKERKESSSERKDKKVNTEDISTMSRIKSAYISLTRMVERFE